jgi:hypothetical protein
MAWSAKVTVATLHNGTAVQASLVRPPDRYPDVT